MFNQLLNKILEDHPLLGLEKEDQNNGHLQGLKAPDWVHQGPIYEVFVRNFTPRGNFAGVRDKIPYLSDLGVKTLWLMPIHPIGQAEKKGTFGSPYAIKDLGLINPSLGTPDEFKELIKTVHENGMKIILDLVANHMATDNVWRKDHPTYFLHDKTGNTTRKISEWSDVVDLDYSNPEVRRKMRKTISSWVHKFDIDGFRCDVAGLVPLDFWEEVYKDLKKIKSDIFLLAEWESANIHPTAFHASYDWSTHFVLQDIYKGKKSASELITWIVEKEANYPRNALPLRFTENHDLDRTREKFGENSFYPFVVFNFILYGLPLIYCGQEIGSQYTPILFEKDPIDWNRGNPAIHNFYMRLISLRQKYTAFSSRELKILRNDKPDNIVSIEKGVRNSKILVILNFSNKQLMVNIELSDSYHNNDQIEDLYLGKRLSRSDLENLKIEPYGFYLFKSTNYPSKLDQAKTDTN